MHILNNQSVSQYFQDLFEKLALKYPEALLYNFNVIFQFKEECKTDLSNYLYDLMKKKFPHNFQFIDALNVITHPEHRLIFYLEGIREIIINFRKEKRTPETLKDLI